MFRTLIARLTRTELNAAANAGLITADEWFAVRADQMQAELRRTRMVTVRQGAFPAGHPLAY